MENLATNKIRTVHWKIFISNKDDEDIPSDDYSGVDLFYGNSCRDNYYNSYRASSKEIKKRKTPFLDYILLCKSKGILPVPHGYAQKRNSYSEIALSHRLISDEYAEAFSQILQYKELNYNLNL